MNYKKHLDRVRQIDRSAVIIFIFVVAIALFVCFSGIVHKDKTDNDIMVLSDITSDQDIPMSKFELKFEDDEDRTKYQDHYEIWEEYRNAKDDKGKSLYQIPSGNVSELISITSEKNKFATFGKGAKKKAAKRIMVGDVEAAYIGVVTGINNDGDEEKHYYYTLDGKSYRDSVSVIALGEDEVFTVVYGDSEFTIDYTLSGDDQGITLDSVFGAHRQTITSNRAYSFDVVIPYGYTAKVMLHTYIDDAEDVEDGTIKEEVAQIYGQNLYPYDEETDTGYDEEYCDLGSEPKYENSTTPVSGSPETVIVNDTFNNNSVVYNRQIEVQLTKRTDTPIFDMRGWLRTDYASNRGSIGNDLYYNYDHEGKDKTAKDGNINAIDGWNWQNDKNEHNETDESGKTIVVKGKSFYNNTQDMTLSDDGTYEYQLIFQTNNNEGGYTLDSMEFNGISAKVPFEAIFDYRSADIGGKHENGGTVTKEYEDENYEDNLEEGQNYTLTTLPDGAVVKIEHWRVFKSNSFPQHVYVVTITGAKTNVTITNGNLKTGAGADEISVYSLYGLAGNSISYIGNEGTSGSNIKQGDVIVNTPTKGGGLQNGGTVTFTVLDSYDHVIWKLTDAEGEVIDGQEGIIDLDDPESPYYNEDVTRENCTIELKGHQGCEIALLYIEAVPIYYYIDYDVSNDLANDEKPFSPQMAKFSHEGHEKHYGKDLDSTQDDNNGVFYDAVVNNQITVAAAPTDEEGNFDFIDWQVVGTDVTEDAGKLLTLAKEYGTEDSRDDDEETDVQNRYIIKHLTLKANWEVREIKGITFEYTIRLVLVDNEGNEITTDPYPLYSQDFVTKVVEDAKYAIIVVNKGAGVFSDWMLRHPAYTYSVDGDRVFTPPVYGSPLDRTITLRLKRVAAELTVTNNVIGDHKADGDVTFGYSVQGTVEQKDSDGNVIVKGIKPGEDYDVRTIDPDELEDVENLSDHIWYARFDETGKLESFFQKDEFDEIIESTRTDDIRIVGSGSFTIYLPDGTYSVTETGSYYKKDGKTCSDIYDVSINGVARGTSDKEHKSNDETLNTTTDTEATIEFVNTLADADVTVTKTQDKDKVVPGDIITYTVTLENTSKNLERAHGISVTDTLPAGLTFVEFTDTPSGTTAAEKDGSITWAAGDIDAGDKLTLEYTAKVDPTTVKTVYKNTAKAEYLNDTDTFVDTSSVTAEFVPGSLKVSKTVKNVSTSELFDITVTLTDLADGDYPITEGGKITVIDGSGSLSVKLADGESLTITGLPEGAVYSVHETDLSDYVTTYENETGTISSDEGSVAKVINSYKSGDLSLTKKVEDDDDGLTADMLFGFTLSFTAPDDITFADAYSCTITGSDGVVITDDLEIDGNGKATIELKNGQTAVINGLPVGTAYKIEETAVAGFVTSSTGDLGTIVSDISGEAIFTNKFSPKPTKSAISGRKTVDGREWDPEIDKYSFKIEAVDKDAPMPNVTETTNEADGAFEFGEIEYSKAGTYEYIITETEPQSGKVQGITYSKEKYKVTVKVEYDRDKGEYTSTVSYGENNEDTLVIVNEYSSRPVDAEITIDKKLTTPSGTSVSFDEGDFTFNVDVKNASGVSYYSATVSNGADNKIKVPLTFKEKGEYTVTITENTSDDSHVTIDSKPITVTYIVDDNDEGQLKAAIKECKYGDDVADISELAFNNKYAPDPVSNAPTVSTTLIDTVTGTNMLGKTAAEDNIYDGAFGFIIDLDEGEADDIILLDNATTNNMGSVVFDEIAFKAPGSYRFVIRQDIPDVIDGQIVYAENNIYVTYKVSENSSGKLTLETVYSYTADGEAIKDPVFENKYEPVPCVLAITCVVTDDANHTDKGFTFDIEMTDYNGDPINGEFVYNNGTPAEIALRAAETPKTVKFADGKARVTLTDGQSIIIEGIPYQTNYSVIVDDEPGYELVKIQSVNGTTKLDVNDAQGTFTNENSSDVYEFTFAYATESVSVQAPVINKHFTGRDMNKGEFSFSMALAETQPEGYAEGGITLPSSDAVIADINNEEETKTATALFENIVFTKAGAYAVEISEIVSKDKAGVTYDESVYTLVYVVSEDGEGHLYVDETASDLLDSITFVNSYVAPTVDDPASEDPTSDDPAMDSSITDDITTDDQTASDPKADTSSSGSNASAVNKPVNDTPHTGVVPTNTLGIVALSMLLVTATKSRKNDRTK